MISAGFNDTDKLVKLYSTLDRVVWKHTVLCEQSDGYNCGVFTVMIRIMRCNGKKGVKKDLYTEDDLKKCRIRCFSYIFDVFRAICPKKV